MILTSPHSICPVPNTSASRRADMAVIFSSQSLTGGLEVGEPPPVARAFAGNRGVLEVNRRGRPVPTSTFPQAFEFLRLQILRSQSVGRLMPLVVLAGRASRRRPPPSGRSGTNGRPPPRRPRACPFRVTFPLSHVSRDPWGLHLEIKPNNRGASSSPART